MSQQVNFYEEVMKRKEELLDDLTQLLKIESTKDLERASPGRPMGDKIGEAFDWMLNLAEQNGFETDQLDGYAGWADLGEGDEPIVALGHLDVVPASGEWSHPPFEPVIKEGKLYARGAIDDKGPTLAAFYAMKIIKELELPLQHKLRLIFGTDEESGMRGMKKYVEEKGQPSYGFSPDAIFPIIYAEKGQINPTLTKSIPSTDGGDCTLKTFHGGERINMVPDECVATVEFHDPLKIEEAIQEFEDFCHKENLSGYTKHKEIGIEFHLNGTSVHGMEPYNGVNAALQLAHFLSRYTFDEQGSQFILFVHDRMYQDFYGKRLDIDVEHEEMGPLTVNAGVFRYELGGKAEIHLNIRCPINTDYDHTIDMVERAGKTYDFAISEIRQKEPHYVDRNHPTIQVMKQAYEEETGEEATLLTTGGATYARFLKNGVAFGALFPGKTMTAHQIDEYIDIDDLLKATAIYARALYELGNLSDLEG
ncbi:dipeptidase PepV [Pontibacillus marinus]|uniref:Xaa-His dipeptidase n=1 Tax=Pontibacillus marinus BH030004 = DSM 16465 TaxID=1385511 RepID=A0A0A5GJ43_9BACI|nr:dipeptidase PepV [Pontibacillus marinus]KGX91248.1 Xaa-His dipeptidase [Pontibacillus marinus BH030004 = DSM 16465]